MGNAILDIIDLIWEWFSVTVPSLLEFLGKPIKDLPGFNSFPSSVLDSGLFDGSLLELVFATASTFLVLYLISPVVKWVLHWF